MRLPVSALVALWLSVSLTGFRPAGPPDPSPDLSPEDVVRIQVEALGHNDEPSPDAGIEVAFRFAAPSNRQITGPLDRFTQMVRTGYADLLDFESAEYGPIRVNGDNAEQTVTLVQRDGHRVRYAFGLTRQHGGPYDRCWMTVGVLRQPDRPTDGLSRI